MEKKLYTICSENASAIIDVSDGMTVVSFKVNGIEYIHYCEKRYDSGATYGIPILYPTPNRVRDGMAHFDGESFCGLMHGAVRKQPFENVKTLDDNAAVYAEIAFNKDKSCFKYFPFLSVFTIKIAIVKSCLIWEYAVENLDDRALGFGIALHPFFVKEPKCKIYTDAEFIMNRDSEFYPNGTISPVQNTLYDLSCGRYVEQLDLDTVYFKSDGAITSKIVYHQNQTTVIVKGDKRCNHVVMYTPKDEEFICVEPQTSSTDCHNLHSKGFVKESNLILVPPKERHTGRFEIAVVLD